MLLLYPRPIFVPVFRQPLLRCSPPPVLCAATTTMQAQAPDVSLQSHILEPVKQGDQDVLLFLLPGAFIDSKAYLPLAKDVQSLSELQLWISIINPGEEVISTEIVEASYDGMIQILKEKGFVGGELAMDNVFMGGHSWGAWTSRSVALKKAQGFIQMGSRFPPNVDNLAEYPKSVLTLCGALDGQLTLAAIAAHAGEIATAEADLGLTNTYAMKPVVLIPGMNHAQFGNGKPNYERGDFDAEIPIEEARKRAAEVISNFLSVQVKGLKDEQALQNLTKVVKQTHSYCEPFWKAMKEPQIKAAKNLQLHVAQFGKLTQDNIVVIQHQFLDNFIYSKPSIDVQENKFFVHIYLSPTGKYDLVKNLWIKMKSREAIASAFGDSGSIEEKQFTAAEHNEEIFDKALSLVSESARKKYMDRGRKLRFIDDLVTATSLDWINGDLSIECKADVGLVQSPVIFTPLAGIASRFAGMHYMKVWTVAGAMRWILEDSFRP